MDPEMHNPNIIIIFHTSVNTGFAMETLERTFFEVCSKISGSDANVFFSFNGLSPNPPRSLPEGFTNYINLNYQDNGTFDAAARFIKHNNIKYALCFDLQPHSPLCKMLRDNGVLSIVSYWGATISSENAFLKLLIKKIEVFLRQNKPDHFIFESHAMQRLAIYGRGIPKSSTSVIPTGIDPEKYTPSKFNPHYLQQEFNIPSNAKTIFYSGHMEKRKGVQVIIESAIELVDRRQQDDVYFIICGNRPNEEQPFLQTLEKFKARYRVIFGGYRSDLPYIMPNCTLGVVASTGWDSFPMSTLEMAGSGLPIVVSRLQGLVETLEEGVTGYTFEPGNALDLADKIQALLDNEALRQQFSVNSRKRIIHGYTREHQINRLSAQLKSTWFKQL